MLHIKKIVLLLLFSGFVSAVSAQTGTSMNDNMGMDNNIQPFTGTSPFRKFSIGVNAGVMTPSVLFGGSNDFAKPQATLGYGANLRYQLNHYFGLQADYLGGTLKGTQDSKDFAVGRPNYSFNTKLKYALSLSGVFTFGNLNFLNTKNHIIPYASVGVGTTGYSTKIVKTAGSAEQDAPPSLFPKNPLFFPVGMGLKFNLSQLLNLDFCCLQMFLF